MATDYQESVFNMALAYLERINKLLYACQNAASVGDVDEWVKHLRGVYREASVRLLPEEEKNILGDGKEKIDVEKLVDCFIEDKEANFRNIYFLTNNKASKLKNHKVIMFLLDRLEVKLRRALQKRGMLLPSKQDPSRAVLNLG